MELIDLYVKMGKPKKTVSGLSREERLVSCIGDIIQELVSCHAKGKDVDLNKLKTRLSSVHALESSPRYATYFRKYTLRFFMNEQL